MGVRLKNEYQSPIGGWQFVDAPISSEPITVWSLDELVSNVFARRRQNPRFNLTLDMGAIRQEALHQNALRMTHINGGEHYLVNAPEIPGPAPGGSVGFTPPQRARRSVAGNRARNLTAGVATLLDWLGEGGEPVDLPVARERAAVCADCPLNQPKDWLAFFTEPVADKLRKQLSIKNEMQLSTEFDDRLNVCSGCGCSLKLKVWCPPEHIVKHTTDEVRAKLDARCWVLKLK